MFSAHRRSRDARKSDRGRRSGSRERRLVVVVVISFALTLVAFVVSRTITEILSRRIQTEAESIDYNALRATEALATARTNIRKLVFAMTAFWGPDHPDALAEQMLEIGRCRREATEAWVKYLSIPFYPGERAVIASVQPDFENAKRAVDDVSARLREGEGEGIFVVIRNRALPAIERADDGLARLIQFNANQAHIAADRILASRRPWGLLPEFFGACFAAAAAYFGVRLLVQYLRWAAERSAELEGFAGRVAHDIRSPLGSASLALDIAQRGPVDAHTRALLIRVSHTMERIGKLVDGLLVFATSGGYIVPGIVGEPKASVAEIVGGAVEDLRFEADAKHVEIDFAAPDPDLVVACSPGVLISMVTNLISNAMKFMGDTPHRRVTVRVHQVGTGVEIGVSDTGPGIAPELRPKVFEPYFRLDSKVPGFGLGLATVRKLAEAHGGSIGLDASSEGGCHFWFRIPLWTAQGQTRVRRHTFGQA